MSIIATLSYSYLYMDFDTYNERFSGTYPNIKYQADVRFRYRGTFKIQATNTVTLGGLQTSIYRYDTSWQSDSGWYHLGTISESMGTSRSKSFSWSCSNSGWPNMSGTASLTTPTIGAPTMEASVKNIGITDITLSARLTDNPYGLYTIRVWRDYAFRKNALSGDWTETGLKANTTYEYHVEAWLADNSGAYVLQKILKPTTLENYAEISIKSIQWAITSKGDTSDDLNFWIETTDDDHVAQSYWDNGSGASLGKGLYFSWPGIPKNYKGTMTAYAIDTLGRQTASVSIEFHSSYTRMEVWRYEGTGWRRGYSEYLNDSKNFKLCRLYVLDSNRVWQPAIPYDDTPNDIVDYEDNHVIDSNGQYVVSVR